MEARLGADSGTGPIIECCFPMDSISISSTVRDSVSSLIGGPGTGRFSSSCLETRGVDDVSSLIGDCAGSGREGIFLASYGAGTISMITVRALPSCCTCISGAGTSISGTVIILVINGA